MDNINAGAGDYVLLIDLKVDGQFNEAIIAVMVTAEIISVVIFDAPLTICMAAMREA